MKTKDQRLKTSDLNPGLDAFLSIDRRSIYPKKNLFGFTLMELLVTISIIAILAAILLPTINSAIERSEVAQAEAEVQSIATAVQAYYNEYSKLPLKDHGGADNYTETGTTSSTDIIRALTGDDGGPVPNPREIVFLKSTVSSSTGEFLDPWDRQYEMKLDADYDGKIEYFNNPGEQYALNVIVISYGPDNTQGDPADSDDIVSYQVD